MTEDTAPPTDEKTEPAPGEKIAKVLARAGVASRRGAEDIVRAGRVAVNGRACTDPAVRIMPADTIMLDGQPVDRAVKTRLWRYHKPAGQVVSRHDAQGRPTVFESLPADMPRVITVGRLDIASEGLLLLTNDGGLARWLELPATGWKRRYRVRAFGKPPADLGDRLARGITIDGVEYGPMEVTLDGGQGRNIWLTIALREGRNREVRRVLAHFGLKVNRLIRTAFGPFQLGNLPRGDVAAVPNRVLRNQAAPYFAEPDTKGKRSHAGHRR